MLGKRKKEIEELRLEISKLETTLKRNSYFPGKSTNEEDFPFNFSVFSAIIKPDHFGFLVIQDEEADKIWLSDIAKQILGLLKPNPIPISLFLNAIHTEDRQKLETMLNNLRTSKDALEIELRIVSDVGKGNSINLRAAKILNEKDYRLIIAGIITDISKFDKLRKDLSRSREKADDLEKSKNYLLSHISHEIRTPMNTIIGYGELLSLGNLSTEKGEEYIKIIKNQGYTLLRLIDDITELSRLGSGQVKISKSPGHLIRLLEEIIVIIKKKLKEIEKDSPDISLGFPSEQDIIIYTDTGRLQQILTSLACYLINNTEKSDLEIAFEPGPDNKILFSFKVKNPIITKEQQRKILNRFANTEFESGKFDSWDIELYIVKNLVKVLGGKVWLESSSDEGTIIFLSIPAGNVPEDFDANVYNNDLIIPRFNWKDKIVLIVEDDDTNLKFLETILHDTGIQILKAHNGFQAIELCKSPIKIDLILMDIKLPDFNGIEASKEIRKINSSIPIIAQTAFIIDEETEEYKQSGIDDFITKPIEIKQFFEKVDFYLRDK